MSRRITPIILAMICVYFDIVFFARVNLLDVRPDAMLAAAVSYGVLMGPIPGAILGCAGGLLSDLIASTSIGLNAALYILAGLAGGFFYKKFYADNIIIPAATAAVCGFGKDFVMMLAVLLGGARFNIGRMLIQYIVPCALMSALFCILVHLTLKPLVARQIKRQEH